METTVTGWTPTERQRQIVALLARGVRQDEGARLLGISPRTFKSHCDLLRQRLGVALRKQIPAAFRDLTGEDPLEVAP